MHLLSVVVTLCHQLTGIGTPVCREEIVLRQEMPTEACVFSQPQIAQWKEHSIFRGEQWTVHGFKCAPGDYVLKDAT